MQQQQGQDDLHERLSAFDLSAPVQITVTFEDSDEDENKPLVIEVNKIENETSKNETSTSKDENFKKRRRKSPSYDDSTSAKRHCDKKDKNALDYCNDLQNNYCQPKSNTETSLQPSAADKDLILKKLLVSNYSCDVLGNNHDYPPNSGQHSNASYSPEGPNPSSNQSSKDTMVKCFTNLLKSVSDNIVEILNMYSSYERYISHSKVPQNKKLNWWNTYMDKKKYLFNLSYCTVLNVILPQEKNKVFMDKFMQFTYNRVAEKDRTDRTHAFLSFLIKDIVEWTKMKAALESSKKTVTEQSETVPPSCDDLHLQQQLSSTVSQQQQYSGASENSKGIQPIPPPIITNNKTNVNQSSSNMEVRTSNFDNPTYNPITSLNQIYSFGPPQNPVTVSVDPKYLNRQQTKHTHSRHSYEYAPYTNPNGEFSTNTNQTKTYPSTELQHHHLQCRPLSNTNVMQQPQSSNYGGNFHQVAPNSVQNGSHFYHQGAFGAPPPYPGSGISNNGQISTPTNAAIQQQVERQSVIQPLPHQVENTRSSSTDSGFMSPVNFSITPVLTNDDVAATEDVPVPYISHVTSLNPKATYMPIGQCHVCRASTKTKCLGCLKTYYCSLDCQKFDWNIHMLICNNG